MMNNDNDKNSTKADIHATGSSTNPLNDVTPPTLIQSQRQVHNDDSSNRNGIDNDNGMMKETIHIHPSLLQTSSSRHSSSAVPPSTSLSSASSSTTNNTPTSPPTPPSFATALCAGGMAGLTVDLALYPMDTLKTRLQAPVGFLKAGGFRGLYQGWGAVAWGSAPGAALFFCTYEYLKPRLLHLVAVSNNNNNADDTEASSSYQSSTALVHMSAASVGEAVACLIRVPTEVIKAHMQTCPDNHSLLHHTQRILYEHRHTASSTPTSRLQYWTGGLYRGYGITLLREIPFAMIQFPLYERLKVLWAERIALHEGGTLNGTTTHALQGHPWAAATCGSISGAIAAAATTPLDVVKTRLMLGKDRQGRVYHGVVDVVRRTLAEEGSQAMWKGLAPRVMWISIGGFVFFGAYEESKAILTPVLG
jgi:solute carrier family 25 (mitochondrial S-adenosylmethionine transporter), member 26